LSELLLVALLFGATSALALPHLLRPRQEFNQENALLHLRLIKSARNSWQAAGNPAPPFFALSGLVPRGDAGLMRQLTPACYKFLGRGGVVFSGYYFSERTSAEGGGAGVLAAPTFNTYSGAKSFWFDYKTNVVSLISDLGALANTGPPSASGLISLE